MAKSNMDWQEYEQEIFEEIKMRYPNENIVKNAKIVGKISKQKRQIDILVETFVLDMPIKIIFDAKKRKSPIDVNDVESFIAMMADVGAHKGVLVATSGYTKSALARAHNETAQDVELDILSMEELKHFQGYSAIPYAGNSGVILRAPFGWVIDATKRKGMVAVLYQRGFDFSEAAKAKEFMYVNFWEKNKQANSLEALLSLQSRTFGGKAKIEYERINNKMVIRSAEVANYPTIEYTGFVEFNNFIFFAVLFSPPEISKRNLKKLREVIRNALPLSVKNDKAQ